MSQYDLNAQKEKKTGCGALIVRGATIILLVMIVGYVALGVSAVLRPQQTARQGQPTIKLLRYAWVEARDTCPDSPEYHQQVARGATLWNQPDTGTNSGYVPHGTKVGVISSSGDFARIDYNGRLGYVQSFFLVDYDPFQDFKPASGDMACVVCSCEPPKPTATATLDGSIERTVLYELNVIDNPGSWMMQATYKEPSGRLQKEKLSVPWRYEFKSLPGTELSVSVKNGLNNNRFECKITVNGETLAHNEGWGERKEATCSGVVR